MPQRDDQQRFNDLERLGRHRSTSTPDAACNNLTTVAANAKAAAILVVTVAYNPGATKCSSASGSATLVATLAAAASPASSGAASAADNDCTTTAGMTAENADGDYFFCAASGTSMAPIFKTAFGQLAKGIKFLQLP